jgi:hypothetical protein
METKMKGNLTKASLSGARRRLLETMQRLNFGRIENLLVRSGEPAFDPAPKIVRDIKIGGENGPSPELGREDFELKTHVADLFDHLNEVGDGSIAVIEVKHGLPFRLVIEQPV